MAVATSSRQPSAALALKCARARLGRGAAYMYGHGMSARIEKYVAHQLIGLIAAVLPHEAALQRRRGNKMA